MKEKRERRIGNQLATFIPECVVFILGIAFLGLLVYNFIPGRNYLSGKDDFQVVGKVLNFVLLIVSCSVAIGCGVGLMVASIVGRYKDRIMWPHHIGFISSFVFMAAGITSMALVLFVK